MSKKIKGLWIVFWIYCFAGLVWQCAFAATVQLVSIYPPVPLISLACQIISC